LYFLLKKYYWCIIINVKRYNRRSAISMIIYFEYIKNNSKTIMLKDTSQIDVKNLRYTQELKIQAYVFSLKKNS